MKHTKSLIDVHRIHALPTTTTPSTRALLEMKIKPLSGLGKCSSARHWQFNPSGEACGTLSDFIVGDCWEWSSLGMMSSEVECAQEDPPAHQSVDTNSVRQLLASKAQHTCQLQQLREHPARGT